MQCSLNLLRCNTFDGLKMVIQRLDQLQFDWSTTTAAVLHGRRQRE
jgi:hypothetical protein